MSKTAKNRVAVVAGKRTPFVKSFSDFKDLTALDLAQHVCANVVEGIDLNPKEIDEVIYSCVISPLLTPNLAREVVLRLGWPRHIPGWSLNKACTSSLQVAISATESIMAGKNTTILCGGVECLSSAPVPFPKRLVDTLLALQKAKSVMHKLKTLQSLNLADFIPQAPKIAEASTGLTMGEHADLMAKQNGISREAQDLFAHRSHALAAAAIKDGRFAQDIAPVPLPKSEKMVSEDNCVRLEPDMDKLRKLSPVFDRNYGTVTAGNASPLTDGASAFILMREDKAKALGYKPLGYVKDYATAAVDPNFQLLLGPVPSSYKVLKQAGMSLKDMDLIDMHEAFAAQALSVIKYFPSKEFAKEHLGSDEPIGEIDMDKLNVYGGSISIGHPFAATGGRMITRSLRELQARKKQYALLTACAAGGMGVSMILEAE